MDAKTNRALPASPVRYDDGIQYDGLTKREAFAMAAMQGMGGSLKWDGAYSPNDLERGQPQKDAQWAASAAVRYADALLAALSREPQS